MLSISVIKDKEVPGLFIRHGKRGDTYIYARNRHGKMIRAALGSVGMFTLKQARDWAHGLNQDEAGVSRAATFTLQQVVDRAVEKARQKGNRQPEYLKVEMERQCADWLPRPLAELTRVMVNDRHDKIARNGGKSAAAHWVKAMKTLFNFADNSLGYEGRNVAKGVDVATMKPRQVVWTDAQMVAFMAAAEVEGEFWHSLFTVIAGTGMRRTNCCQMEWSELDLVAGVWTIPAEKFKNKEPHRVHLTPAVMAAIARRRAVVWDECQWVFPSPTSFDGDVPLHSPIQAFYRICKAAKVKGITIHDLRRTLGSRLAARVPLQVVAMVLGHKTITTTMKSYAVIADSVARDALLGL